MFCHKCGAQIESGDRFCAVCGSPRPDAAQPSQPQTGPVHNTPPAPQQPITPPPVYSAPVQPQQPIAPPPVYAAPAQPQQPYAQPYADAPPVRKKAAWKLIVPICIVLVVGIAAALYFLVFASPAGSLAAAFEGLQSEMSERINGTPLKAIATLPEALKNGQISVDFDYTDYWGDNVSGVVKLQTDTEKRDYAILADLSMYGQRFDLNAYLNSKRLALKSSLLDENYYGFEYATFREDIDSFGRIIGLDSYTMDMLADIVDMLSETMNQKTTTEANQAYADVLANFLKGLDAKSSKAALPFAKSGTTYKKLEYVVTKDALLKLLNDYYAAMEADESLREQFDNYGTTLEQFGVDPYYDLGFDMDYDDFLDSFEDLIDMVEKEYEGVTNFSFYLDGKRLVCIAAKAEIEIDGETALIDLVYDFGTAPGQPWVITATVTNPYGDEETATLTWDYSVTGDEYVNEITVAMGEGRSASEVTLSSTWSKSSGDFTFAYDDGYNEGEFSGNFKETANGFVLILDNLIDDYYDEELALTITVEKGIKIDDPKFIGLDKWDEDLIYKLEDLIYSLY